MFAEMTDAFLPMPVIEVTDRAVTVTLRNTPTLSDADHSLISRLDVSELSRPELRSLLHAHREGQIDNAKLRGLTGLDTLNASLVLRGLRDKDLLELHNLGSRSFYTLAPYLAADERTVVGELSSPVGELTSPVGELPSHLQGRIAQLGQRPNRERVFPVIQEICSQGDWVTSAEIASHLNFKQSNLTWNYLSPMVEKRLLERRYPDNTTHPQQAYRAVISQLTLPLAQ